MKVEGKVSWYDSKKGFGVIEYDEKEFFVHHSGIVSDSNKKVKKNLNKDQIVKFEISNNNGKECAINVTDNNDKPILFSNSQKNDKRKRRVKNTESFEPSHEPADMYVRVGNSKTKQYNFDLKAKDVIVVTDLFEGENIYNNLLEEVKEAKVKNKDELWKLWHGESHWIADDHLEWKDQCPTFAKVIDKISEYFKMKPKSTRLNWYENSDHWKPYHHDAAAIKPHIAAKQNITVGVSFGAEREIAFEHAQTKSIVSFPMPDGCVYAFGNDVNSEWRHGIPQLPKDQKHNEGRISIIAWGWAEQE